MSQSNESYRQFKLIKELREKQSDNYVNDYHDNIDIENTYCDLCDRKLEQFDIDRVFCPTCEIVTDIKFNVIKHKPSRIGPVDGDVESGNDSGIISEYYTFGQRTEEKDTFVDSLKGKGYQIISSSKQ